MKGMGREDFYKVACEHAASRSVVGLPKQRPILASRKVQYRSLSSVPNQSRHARVTAWCGWAPARSHIEFAALNAWLTRHSVGVICVEAQLGLRGPRGCLSTSALGRSQIENFCDGLR